MILTQFYHKPKPLWKFSRRRYIMPLSVLAIGLSFIAISVYLLNQPPATQAILPFGQGLISIKTDASYSFTVNPTRAVTGEGTAYQIDPVNKTIQKFDKAGRLLTEWASKGSLGGQSSTPQLIGLDLQEQVYVYDNVNNSIQKFDSSGRFLMGWPVSNSGSTGISLAVTETGNIYLLLENSRGYIFSKFDANGKLLTQSGFEGRGNFYAIQIDSDGLIYTLSSDNYGPLHMISYSISDAPNNKIYYKVFSREARVYSKLGWGFLLCVVLGIMLIGLARLLEIGLKDLKIVPDSSYLPVKRLKSPDVNLRVFGVKELGILADPDAFEPILKAFHDPEPIVRGSAAWALGRLGNQKAVEPLLQALPDETFEVQVNIVIALGELHDSRAVEPLLSFLKSEYADLRFYSATALSKLGMSGQ